MRPIHFYNKTSLSVEANFGRAPKYVIPACFNCLKVSQLIYQHWIFTVVFGLLASAPFLAG